MRKVNGIAPSTSTSTDSTTNDLHWSYTPVQHADDRVAVHAASYDKNGTIVCIEPSAQKLEDLSVEHLTNFLSTVLVGLVNKPVVSAADFKRLVRKAA
jgi:hypothetical protein